MAWWPSCSQARVMYGPHLDSPWLSLLETPEFTCYAACGDSDPLALASLHAASKPSSTPFHAHSPGITMSHYTRRNMSRSTQAFSSSVFRLLAGICESVVFVYIGE